MKSILAILAAAFILFGCESGGDYRDSGYSDADIIKLKRRAADLDMAAISALQGHYASAREAEEAAKWEEHLILLGNHSALTDLAERKYIHATKIPSNNPERLMLLREALFLYEKSHNGRPQTEISKNTEARYRKAIETTKSELDGNGEIKRK